MSNLKKLNMNDNILHKGFEIEIALKAVNAFWEIIGGILLTKKVKSSNKLIETLIDS